MRPVDADRLKAEFEKVNLGDVAQRLIDTAPTVRMPQCPCDLCINNPPSSLDGKPCCYCPASGLGLEERK